MRRKASNRPKFFLRRNTPVALKIPSKEVKRKKECYFRAPAIVLARKIKPAYKSDYRHNYFLPRFVSSAKPPNRLAGESRNHKKIPIKVLLQKRQKRHCKSNDSKKSHQPPDEVKRFLLFLILSSSDHK